MSNIGEHIAYTDPFVADFTTGERVTIRPSNGVRLQSEGFTFDAVTVEVVISGADPDSWREVPEANSGSDLIICEGFPVDKVRVSGTASGTIAVYRV